jgi:hypothetical protein
VFIRPVNAVNFNGNYFMPSMLGGDHAIKFGSYWRDANSESISHTGGNATVRFPNQAAFDNDTCVTSAGGCQVALTRDGHTVYDLTNIAAFAQDTITHGRLTAQLGVRYDRNHDQALAATIPASPLMPSLLPAVNFGGVDPKIVFNNFSPRLGLTYDLQGNGKTIVRGNYARYYGQVGTGGVSGQVNPLSSVTVRYNWVDLNGDRVFQPNEVTGDLTKPVVAPSGNWDPNNPTAVATRNTNDPNLKNDTTDEFIVGGSRELGKGFAVDANYIYRKYTNLTGTFQVKADGTLVSSNDYLSMQYTPPASACPSGARCDTVTAYYPSFAISGLPNEQVNLPNFNRTFNGVEVTGRKRMANHWMMNTSFTYNSTIVNYGDTNAFQDPTNISNRDGFQYDYLTSGSGLGNVYVNAKWLYKLSGMYQLPWAVNVSAFYNARQGYPFEPFILTPTRANNGGQASVLLDAVGENRLPTFQNVDFHVERPITFMNAHFVPSMDIFNLGNFNTVQALQRQQNANNANRISSVVAPRVIRFGIRVNW